jgi:hypothetical protein
MLVGSVMPVRSHPLRLSDPPMLVGSVMPVRSVRSHPDAQVMSASADACRQRDSGEVAPAQVERSADACRQREFFGSVMPVRSHPLR